MYPVLGRWTYNFFVQTEGKSFEEVKVECQNMNSIVSVLKEASDHWAANWLIKNEGGPDKEMYVGLDPYSLQRRCTADGWTDNCEGLRWLDGSPFERRAASFGVETNGLTSVNCFILTVNSSTNQSYIRGVRDCDVKRSASCVSDCLYPRCPIPRGIKNGQNNWYANQHIVNDKVRFVH